MILSRDNSDALKVWVSGEGEVQNNHTLHLLFSEGCCNMQLFMQDRKDWFGRSGRKVTAATWEGILSGDALPSSASPVDSCSLLWLDGHLCTLNGEENTAAVSKDSGVEFLVQCHIENVCLNRRKDGNTGTTQYKRILSWEGGRQRQRVKPQACSVRTY